MTDRIEAHVAQVLTARELVLNKGATDGIEVGMRFAILNRRGADIKDPETGEILGSVELEKSLVKVVRIHERLCVARTFRTYTTPGGPLYGIGSLTRPPRTRYETLETDESRLRDELDEAESFVKIGDLAVQVIGEEFDAS